MSKFVQQISRWREIVLFKWGRLRYRIKHRGLRLTDPLALMSAVHWMQLGQYRQYDPRPPKYDHLRAATKRQSSFAIVTPSYNQGEYLEQTICSVLNQNQPQLNYAVVDGGSTDSSLEIINKYKNKLAFHVSEKDNGQSDAIQKGFASIEGEIMGYLNSDDLLAPGILNYVGAYFAAHPEIDVVYGHRIIIDENSQEIGRWILPRYDALVIKHFDYIPQETMFWRRNLFEKVGGINKNFQFAMDWDLILRFEAVGARFQRLPHFLACFRAHSAQKSQSLLQVGQSEMQSLMDRENALEAYAVDGDRVRFDYQRRAVKTALAMGLGWRR